MKPLQNLQGKLLGLHFLSFPLNLAKDSITFVCGGINSQILGPKYNKDSDSLQTLWIRCAIKCNVFLR